LLRIPAKQQPLTDNNAKQLTEPSAKQPILVS